MSTRVNVFALLSVCFIAFVGCNYTNTTNEDVVIDSNSKVVEDLGLNTLHLTPPNIFEEAIFNSVLRKLMAEIDATLAYKYNGCGGYFYDGGVLPYPKNKVFSPTEEGLIDAFNDLCLPVSDLTLNDADTSDTSFNAQEDAAFRAYKNFKSHSKTLQTTTFLGSSTASLPFQRIACNFRILSIVGDVDTLQQTITEYSALSDEEKEDLISGKSAEFKQLRDDEAKNLYPSLVYKSVMSADMAKFEPTTQMFRMPKRQQFNKINDEQVKIPFMFCDLYATKLNGFSKGYYFAKTQDVPLDRQSEAIMIIPLEEFRVARDIRDFHCYANDSDYTRLELPDGMNFSYSKEGTYDLLEGAIVVTQSSEMDFSFISNSNTSTVNDDDSEIEKVVRYDEPFVIIGVTNYPVGESDIKNSFKREIDFAAVICDPRR